MIVGASEVGAQDLSDDNTDEGIVSASSAATAEAPAKKQKKVGPVPMVLSPEAQAIVNVISG
jgi:hypothetical protein